MDRGPCRFELRTSAVYNLQTSVILVLFCVLSSAQSGMHMQVEGSRKNN